MAVFGPRTLYVLSPKQEALNLLRRLASPRVAWDTCRLIYHPATLLRGEDNEHKMLVTGVAGSIEQRTEHEPRKEQGTAMAPFRVEHCIAFDASPPYYNVQLSILETTQGFTQIFELRRKSGSANNEQDHFEAEVRALTDYCTTHGIEDTIRHILGPLSSE